MADLHYQRDLSLQSPILLDGVYKKSKVDKMLAVLRDVGAVSEQPRTLAVDIGCSRGFFASGLAPHFRHVVGVDIDTHALRLAVAENPFGHVTYLVGDSLRLPLRDGCADLIICNHVYEHVPDPQRLFGEIHRVLKDSGVCYFSAASRLIPIEPHYHLPFLSWLPKPLAHLYMRLTGRGDRYYENLRTYWGIRRLIGHFQVTDYTLKILSDPDRFQARDLLPKGGLLAKVPPAVWKALYWLLPTYILILRRVL
ncbi:MAG: methyltransferase domain-containing protein [Chromatiales bacterium]